MSKIEFTQCPNRRKCSGCQLQNLSYPEQLSHKQNMVQRLVGELCPVEPIIGMDNPLHYRNKVQAAIGYDYRKKAMISGVYQSTTQRICATDECMIEDEICSQIVVTVRQLLQSFKLGAYDHSTGKGFARHILVRRGFATGQIMVVIVSGTKEFRKKSSLVNALVKRYPDIKTVVHNVNDTDTRLFLGEYSEVLYGDGYIEDVLCGYTFRISPASFYQVNPTQTEILYSRAIELAGLTGSETVFDSYCGTGTIGIIASGQAGRVIGVELNSDAVDDAIANARINGVDNIQFHCADAGKFITEYANAGESIDVLLMDPPRAGSDRKFLSAVLRLMPSRIVYVSCNPETLARDLRQLTRSYSVLHIQPVDMFPYTNHVECVVLLSKVHN